MADKLREKNFKYIGPLNCASSQFNTIQLISKPKVNRCPHCLKTFSKPSGLKAHIFSHTGEKPHKCPVTNCNRYFSLLSNLRRHMKIHSKENTKNRLYYAKKPVPKIRPLLPVGQSLTNQLDSSASQTDQGQQQFDSGHGTPVDYDYATSAEFSPPSENLAFAPITSLEMASSLYHPAVDFQNQMTHDNLQDVGAHIQMPTFSAFPTGLEQPAWSWILSSEPQLSIDELHYLEILNHQYPSPQQPIYPYGFFLKGDFLFYK